MKENKELTFKERFLLAQSSVKSIDKDGKNPHFKSAYTTLPHALEQILPHLQANKLIYRTELTNNKLVTIIEDVYSDQQYKTEFELIGTLDMQKLGSAITYAQRYGLLSIMGLASGIDDDGNDASEKRVAIELNNVVNHKKIIEDDKVKNQFKELIVDNKALFSDDELAIYRGYVTNNEIDKIKNAIVQIQTRIMKG